MSKAAKSIVVFLFLLLFVSVGLLTYTFLEKQKSDTANLALEKQVSEFQSREKTYIVEGNDLKAKIEAAKKEKEEIEKQLSSVDAGVEDLEGKIKTLTAERDKWKDRSSALQKERDELLVKIKQKSEESVVYKYIERDPEEQAEQQQAQEDDVEDSPSGDIKIAAEAFPSTDNEAYWAMIIKEKTALELEVDELKERLTDSQVKIEEMKKINSDLEMELGALKNEKEDISRKIKHGNDLSDSLSLALARSENDKKFLNDRLVKVSDENIGLRDQIKNLGSTKVALEKSIVRLQEEKKGIEDKLLETENVIQNRIDEIWKIKEELQNSVKSGKAQSSSEVELPPIVVSQQALTEGSHDDGYVPPGFDGNVVSVNADHNFVIIDLGEDDGLKLGDNMSVYRGAEYVASLEVIQVRRDIAAADIRNKVDDIRSGDIVR